MLRRLMVGCIAIAMPFVLGCLVAFTGPTVSAAIFVTNLIDGVNSLPIPGNQPWPGQLGDDFTTTAPIVISSVGVFDSNGDGTTVPLTWRLYEVATGNLIHQEIILPSAPTGGGGIESNYIFQDLASDIVLAANTAYSAVAVGFGVGNENFNTNLDPGVLDVVFSTVDLTAAGGRYSNTALPGLPVVDAGNTVSTNPYNFGAATFVYNENGTVPEPTSIVVWSLFVGLGVIIVRRRVSI